MREKGWKEKKKRQQTRNGKTEGDRGEQCAKKSKECKRRGLEIQSRKKYGAQWRNEMAKCNSKI